MKFAYKPKTEIEKFGLKIFNLLVENFPQTFFVGGMVRDLLLKKPITDIDITTSARPDEIIYQLNKNKIPFDAKGKSFGTITAKQDNFNIEITTFRSELYSHNRYPKVRFINNARVDSQRRDFTINSLYLRAIDGEILDFHRGIKDLKSNLIRFIGKPEQRIQEDPLRIIRALRFCETLNLKLERNTFSALKKHFGLIKTLTKSRLENEINKVRDAKLKNILKRVLNNPKMLDKFVKKL